MDPRKLTGWRVIAWMLAVVIGLAAVFTLIFLVMAILYISG